MAKLSADQVNTDNGAKKSVEMLILHWVSAQSFGLVFCRAKVKQYTHFASLS